MGSRVCLALLAVWLVLYLAAPPNPRPTPLEASAPPLVSAPLQTAPSSAWAVSPTEVRSAVWPTPRNPYRSCLLTWPDTPRLAVDGAGAGYALWADSAQGYAIYFAYRPPAGTWGQPVKISGEGNDPNILHYSPALALDTAGNAYAVWIRERFDDTVFVSYYDVYFAYRPSGPGSSWSLAAKINDDPARPYNTKETPTIAVDPQGIAYTAWVDRRDEANGLFFAFRPAGATSAWSANVRINQPNDPLIQTIPVLAVDRAGNAHIVWTKWRYDSELQAAFFDLYAAYRPAGITSAWSATVKVNDDTGLANQGFPTLVVDPEGQAYAAWQDYREGNWDIYLAQRPPGVTGQWSANRKLNDDNAGVYQGAPSLAVDGTGKVAAIWEDYRDIITGLYWAERQVDGHWSANQRVNRQGGVAEQGTPWLAAAAGPQGGRFYTLWVERRVAQCPLNALDCNYYDILSAEQTEAGWQPAVAVTTPANAVDQTQGSHGTSFSCTIPQSFLPLILYRFR